MEGDAGEAGELGFETVPEPLGNILEGGIFEAGNVIEITVVELAINDGFGNRGEFRVVHEPATHRVDLAFDHDLGLITMSVESRAFVFGRDIRQFMGGFKEKVFFEFNFHRGERECDSYWCLVISIGLKVICALCGFFLNPFSVELQRDHCLA